MLAWVGRSGLSTVAEPIFRGLVKQFSSAYGGCALCSSCGYNYIANGLTLQPPGSIVEMVRSFLHIIRLKAVPTRNKRPRRTTNIAEEQAMLIEQMSEFNRVGLSGTVRLLLDEALAARKGEPLTLSALRENLEGRSDEELIAIMRFILDILETRSTSYP